MANQSPEQAKRQKLMAIGAVIVLVLAGGLVWFDLRPRHPAAEHPTLLMYNVATGELKKMPFTEAPPLTVDGATWVGAMVAPGKDPVLANVLYLYRYTEAGKKAVPASVGTPPMPFEEVRRVAQDSPWVSAISPAASSITNGQ